MKLLRLRARWRQWRSRRTLQRSGYETWAQYRHNRDPDVCRYANTVEAFYGLDRNSGYKHVYAIDDYNHPAYQLTHDWGPGGMRYGVDEIRDWIDTHCRFKTRLDCHRVWKTDRMDEYHLNDIGGRDIIFVAFKDERDYVLFLLRWL